MNLGSLRVLHRPKKSGAEVRVPGAFVLDTCQRTLWVLSEPLLEVQASWAAVPGVELFSGAEAYEFLLRVATGLESEVKGETDIFGQIKEAWSRFEAQGSFEARELAPWIAKLFEDTKEIRARFLQNAGAPSYGSLLRKLIRSLGEAKREPILLLGAGQIAQSLAPWLTDHELWIANRSEERAQALALEVLAKDPKARVEVKRSGPPLAHALAQAAQLVVCISPEASLEGDVLEQWRRGGADRPVFHMGGAREACGPWAELPGFHGLDELFELQRTQNDARSELITRALRACRERACLRALPGSSLGSANLPHGWEDLAVFAV